MAGSWGSGGGNHPYMRPCAFFISMVLDLIFQPQIGGVGRRDQDRDKIPAIKSILPKKIFHTCFS